MAIVVTVISASSVANAANAPTAQLSFSPATISAGSKPDMTFMSQDVPSGSLVYLQESSHGGQLWRTVGKTTDTQGTAKIAALSEGDYEFRIIITDNGTELGMSAPATLTVTGPGGVMPTPGPEQSTGSAPVTARAAPSPVPSGWRIPWLDIVVKPVWDGHHRGYRRLDHHAVLAGDPQKGTGLAFGRYRSQKHQTGDYVRRHRGHDCDRAMRTESATAVVRLMIRCAYITGHRHQAQTPRPGCMGFWVQPVLGHT